MRYSVCHPAHRRQSAPRLTTRGRAGIAAAASLLVGASFVSTLRAERVAPPTWVPVARLQAPTRNALAFGQAVALRGDRLAVGAPETARQAGAVFVSTRNVDGWSEPIRVPAQARPGGLLGSELAWAGDELLVSHPGVGRGRIERFAPGRSTLRRLRALEPSSGAAENFGLMLATSRSGERLIATVDEDARTRLVVYVRDAASTGGWTQEAALVSPGSAWMSVDAIAVDGDVIAVGNAYERARASGSVVIFVRSGGSWHHTQTLTTGDAQEGDQFGCSVALHGDVLVAGARMRRGGRGAAYVFERDASGRFVEQAVLEDWESPVAPEQYHPLFGQSVALEGRVIVVGDLRTHHGGARAFVRRAAGWAPLGRFARATGDGFGAALAVDGGHVAIGAFRTGAGAAFVFDVPVPTP